MRPFPLTSLFILVKYSPEIMYNVNFILFILCKRSLLCGLSRFLVFSFKKRCEGFNGRDGRADNCWYRRHIGWMMPDLFISTHFMNPAILAQQMVLSLSVRITLLFIQPRLAIREIFEMKENIIMNNDPKEWRRSCHQGEIKEFALKINRPDL